MLKLQKSYKRAHKQKDTRNKKGRRSSFALFITFQKQLWAHAPCSNDEKRQISADAIISWMGDVRFAGRHIDLPWGTPMILMGDMNLVGEPQPETTLLTGNIIDEDVYCQDVHVDWDNTDLLDVVPLDPNTGDDFTWQGSSLSRLDRFMVTQSVMTIGNSFVFNTDTMTAKELKLLGVFDSDTSQSVTSDHLPIVLDFQPTIFNSKCDADIDGNGIVDITDLLGVINGWSTNGDCCPGCVGDIDGDLAVDVTDLLELISFWGTCQ